jgi:hypothetical protein
MKLFPDPLQPRVSYKIDAHHVDIANKFYQLTLAAQAHVIALVEVLAAQPSLVEHLSLPARTCEGPPGPGPAPREERPRGDLRLVPRVDEDEAQPALTGT